MLYIVVVDTPCRRDTLTDERFANTIAQLRQESAANGRVDALTAGHTPGKYALINRPDGYWIAGANPEAAHEAITGGLPLDGPSRGRRAALLTDGASCAVDPYGFLDWRQLLYVVTEEGPQELIRRVRQAENADPDAAKHPRYKRHDDATVALCLFEESA